MSYDARARGADCDRCPLRSETPVPPEIRPGARAILIGEGPGESEVRAGRPFVGPSGIELERALLAVGVRRSAASVTNAILCPLPDFKRARLDADLRKENKRRAALKEPPTPHPLACCQPRLFRDLADSPANVITLGGTAQESIGLAGSTLNIRGGPREVKIGDRALRVLPTMHPAFVLRSRRWTRAFVADLGRAFRWFSTGLAWQDPEILYRPTADELRAWLDREAGTIITYDVETVPGFSGGSWRHFDPCFDKLRYLGLASADGRRVVGIPFVSLDTGAPFYRVAEGKALVAVLRDFFVSPRWRKGGWNCGYYDRPVIERHFGVVPAPIVDGIGLHKMVEPELPHRLGYAGSVYTDAPAWKDEYDAKEIQDDDDMKRYNALDVSITAMTIPQLARAVVERKQERAARFWPFVQGVCVELHKNGMFVDQARREAWDLRLRKDARFYRDQVRAAVGREKFNPNSVVQLRDLFFDEWQLLPYGDPTDAGDPSTDDETLRAFLSPAYSLTEPQRQIVKAVRRYRATTKMRGTYVVRLRPIGTMLTDGDLAFDEEEPEEDRAKRIKRLEERPGLVLADGRVHPDYNGHGTIGWRLSSSGPNAQNFPDDLRDMIIAAPGYVLVGCDEAQLELRMVAALAGAQVYLAALNAGEDPHAILCEDFFGETYTRAGDGEKKSLRRFVKEFTYASFYLATDPTKHAVLTSSEGWICPDCEIALDRYVSRCERHPEARPERRLLYPDLSLRDVSAFSRKWLDRNIEIEAWWEREQAEFQRQGYIAEPIFGLRRDFLDGERDGLANEIVNLKPQSGGSALVHLATEIILRELPKYGGRIIQQGHDSLVSEVPKDHERYRPREGEPKAEFGYCPPGCGCRANRVARMKEEAMNVRGDRWGLPVRFQGEAKIGETWQKV